MPGGVVEVRENRRAGFLERGWLSPILRAVVVSGRHFFHNLRARRRTGATVPGYAGALAQVEDVPVPRRGVPALLSDSTGRPRCVGCELCARICPSRCIRMEVSGRDDGSALRDLDLFEIDLARCLFCGLCEEVCPADALALSPLLGLAHSERSGLILDLPRLLVPASLLHGSPAQPVEAAEDPQ